MTSRMQSTLIAATLVVLAAIAGLAAQHHASTKPKTAPATVRTIIVQEVTWRDAMSVVQARALAKE